MSKRKSRSGLIDVPPDVTPLREAAASAVEELRSALEVVQAAALASAALDAAQTARIQDRFDAVGRPASPR